MKERKERRRRRLRSRQFNGHPMGPRLRRKHCSSLKKALVWGRGRG
jgi:hypothetical protein